MSDLISSQELRHRLCNGFISHDGYVDGEFRDVFAENGITFEMLRNPDSPYGKLIELVVQIIESLPAAERPKGEWIYQTMAADEEIMEAQCNQCKRYALQPYGWGGHFDLEYCPRCGAHMRGEKDG